MVDETEYEPDPFFEGDAFDYQNASDPDEYRALFDVYISERGPAEFVPAGRR